MEIGHDETCALLVAGVDRDGNKSKVFEGDLALMKTVLTSKRVGIKKENLVTVAPDPAGGNTMTRLHAGIDQVAEKLSRSKNGHFIFYYSGHFTQRSSFVLGGRMYYKDYNLAQDLKRVPAKFMLIICDMCFSGSADFNVRNGVMNGSDSVDGPLRSSASRPGAGPAIPPSPPIPRMWEYVTRKTPDMTETHHGRRERFRSDGPDGRSDMRDTRPLHDEPASRRSVCLSGDSVFHSDERDVVRNTHRTRVPEKVVQWGSSLPTEKSWSFASSVFTKSIHDILLRCKGKYVRNKMRQELDDLDTNITVPHLNIHVQKMVDDELKLIQTPYVKPELNDVGDRFYHDFPQFANIRAGGCCGCCPL